MVCDWSEAHVLHGGGTLENSTIIAHEQMPEDVQRRARELMDKNSRGEISPEEYGELEKLVERGDRLMARKAEAAAILPERECTFQLVKPLVNGDLTPPDMG